MHAEESTCPDVFDRAIHEISPDQLVHATFRSFRFSSVENSFVPVFSCKSIDGVFFSRIP